MKRKLIGILLILVMLVVACGSTETGTSGTKTVAEQGAVPQSTVAEGVAYASDVTILQFAVTRQDRNQYDSLIDAFEAEHGDVHIVTVSIEDALGVNRPGAEWPDDAYLLLASAADVIAAPATRQAVQQGALLELSHFFESDPNLNADAFYPNVMDSVQWDGGIWSLPVEATYPLIYFDKTKFDAAGLDYPQPGWTWDDLLAAAQALTIRDGDAVTQWGFVPTSFDPVTFVQAQAGPLFDPDTEPPTAKLDSAAVEDAVRWYTDLFLTHGVAPYAPSSGEMGPGGFGGDTGMRLVSDGQAAMWFGTTFGGRMFGRGQQQQVTGVVPMPVNSADDLSTPMEVDALSISAGTQKQDLAWEWITFLAQQRARRGPGRNFGGMMTTELPAQPSVAAAAGVWDNLDEDQAAALNYAIEHAYVDTYDGAGYDTFNDAVVDILENGTAVETALQSAQATVEAEIEEEVAAAPTPVADLVVSQEIDEAVSAGATMITFGTAGGGGMGRPGGFFGQQSLTTLVDEFQAAHPDILVELETPEGFRGGLDLATMAAEYDCFQASPSMSEEALAAILSMEPFLSADPDVDKEDFYPGVLDQFVYQGQIWGLPGSATANLINYNKDLFDAAGLDYPALDWTTTDFLQAAVALTQRTADPPQYGYVPSQQGVNDLVNLMDRLGVDLFDDSQDPPTLVLDSPEAEQVMRWYAGLTTEYEVTPDLDELSGGEPGPGGDRARQTLINQGQVAMWTGGGAGPGPGGFGQAELNTGVVPLPSGSNSAQGSGFQSVDGYFISSQTQARQACWEWITFLTTQPSAALGLPARQETAESDEYRQQVGEERADAYLASVSVGNRASFFQRMADEGNWLMFASNWLSNAYNSIIDGEMTVEEALADAQTKVDDFRACVIANDAFDDMQAVRSCAQEVGGTMGGPP